MSFLSNLLTIPVVRQNSHISESQIPDFSIFKFDLIKILPPLRFYIYISSVKTSATYCDTATNKAHSTCRHNGHTGERLWGEKDNLGIGQIVHLNTMGRKYGATRRNSVDGSKYLPYDIAVSSGRGDVEKEKKEGKNSNFFLLLRAEKERENRRKEKSSSDRVTWSGESFVVVRASFTSRPIPFLLPLPIRDRRYTLASLVILLAPTTTLHKTNLI